LINLISQLRFLVLPILFFIIKVIISQLIQILNFMSSLISNFLSMYLVFHDKLIKYLQLSCNVIKLIWIYLFGFQYFLIYCLLFLIYVLKRGICIINILLIYFILFKCLFSSIEWLYFLYFHFIIHYNFKYLLYIFNH
jgi:hypothetical protein